MDEEVERCEVCGEPLVDDEGCSWPYCPEEHDE